MIKINPSYVHLVPNTLRLDQCIDIGMVTICLVDAMCLSSSVYDTISDWGCQSLPQCCEEEAPVGLGPLRQRPPNNVNRPLCYRKFSIFFLFLLYNGIYNGFIITLTNANVKMGQCLYWWYCNRFSVLVLMYIVVIDGVQGNFRRKGSNSSLQDYSEESL